MQLFGGLGASHAQSSAYAVQQQEIGSEENIESQKQQAYEIQNKRAQMQNFRNTQRNRAMGLNSSVNQGAQFGSGMSGGQAETQDEGTTNTLGLTQSLQTSRNIFADNTSINADKVAIAGYQSTAGTDQGISSMGGMIAKSAGTMSNISGAASAGMSSFGNWAGSQMIPPGALSGGYGKQ